MSTAQVNLAPITKPLKAVRRRIRLIAFGHGVFRTAWIILTAVVVEGVADYFLQIPGLIRMITGLCIAGYTFYSFVRYAIRPLVVPLSLDVIAAEVEKQHPELQDRLRSSLTFSENGEAGSEAMQDLVLRETYDAMRSVDVQRITNPLPLRRALIAFLPAFLVFASLLVWVPALVLIGVDRLVRPMANVHWPKSVQIELLQRLPSQIPAGQRLQLALRLKQGDRPDRKVVVSWQIPGQSVQQQLMQRGADGAYATILDVRSNEQAAKPNMTLSITAGDDTYGPVSIELIPRLQLRQVRLEATAPAYCGIGVKTFDLQTQSASVPAGSQLVLSLAFNRPAHKISIEPVNGSESATLPEMQWTYSTTVFARAQWQAMQSLRFRIHAQDEGGFANSGTEEYEILVRPDQLPVIQLDSPRRSDDRTPEATVPLLASVEDDYGISSVVLEARLLAGDSQAGNASTTQPAALELVSVEKPVISEATFAPTEGDPQRRRFKLAFPWKLASFPSSLMKPGDVVEFQLAVKDTYDLNGQRHPVVKTPPLRFTIVSQDQLLQHTYDDLRQLASQIGELKVRQDRLRNDTAQLREDSGAKPKLDPGDEAVAERIADQQMRAVSQAKDMASRLNAISSRLQENASPNADLQKSVQSTASMVDQAAEQSMKPAAANVKQASDRNTAPESRNNRLADAAKQQRKASEQLSQAIGQLGDLGGLQRAVDIVSDILAQQRKLSKESEDFARAHPGQRPEDMKPADKKALDDLAKRQSDLAKQSDQAIEQLKAMADRQANADPSASQAMAQASQTGKTQSVPQHQQAASGAMSKNQSSQASSSQQNAESGLQQMLSSLREAQQRKLEELVRKLANLEEQLKNLVHRQAGHNLDNLLIQNPQAVQADTSGLAKTLMTKSGRKEAGTAPELGQLTSSQEQTHRNTADLADDLSKVKGADEAAGHLNRAAGRMEHATALLKHNDLANALAPSQMEALAELELTLQQVQEMRKKSEQETEKKKQDELRQAYEQIKAQQIQVRDVTKQLDEALSGGQRKRSDLVRVAQIATDQKKLSDRVQALGDELAQLGSVVFHQVNATVARDMSRVSEQLSQQKTDKPVQFAQSQIIARIDAILRGLTPPEPDESKYASHSSEGGGGGGGGQKRKLPPAAELQLLRDLQALVNQDTHESKPQDTEVLPEIGSQQGNIRTSLDNLVKKAAGEEASMPNDQQSREPVPEEAVNPANAENEDFDQQLLNGESNPTAGAPVPSTNEKKDELGDIRLMARRMTRSQVRLAESHDPGQVTQLVQKKILESLDRLIDESKKNQQQQQSSSQQQSQSQQQPKPKEGQQKNENNTTAAKPGQSPAQRSEVRPGEKNPAAGGDIRETAKDWAGISARDRQAIIESAGEDIIEKYRTLTEEYYRALSTKATQNR